MQAVLSAEPAIVPQAAVATPGARPPQTSEMTSAVSDDLEDATVSAPEEDAPHFPDDETEMAMRSELRARGESVELRRAPTAEPEEVAPLPPLDQLVSQLSPEVREVLDELFRARFTAVRRVPAQALKESVGKND